MLPVLALIVPLGLGGAVSPMMLTEQSLVLSTGGRRAARLYALGAVSVLLAFVLLIVLFGSVVKLPTAPTLSATLDIVLGAALIALGVGVRFVLEHPRHRSAGRGSGHGVPVRPEASFPFGVFSMATNFTTLPLAAVAAKEIAAADVTAFERGILIAILVAICSIPAWLPIALTAMAPRAGGRVLDLIKSAISRYGGIAVVVLLFAAGTFLLARGILNA